MKFVISDEWTKNTLLRLIIIFFLFYTVLLWGTNWLLYFAKMGLTASSVESYYLGSEQLYRQPRSYQGLLEMSHFHLFAMGILLLTLTHLLLFVPVSIKLKAWLVVLSFTGGFCNELSGWLIRFLSPHFSYLKILSFLTLQLSMAVIMLLIAYALIYRMPSGYSDSDPSSAKGGGNCQGA